MTEIESTIERLTIEAEQLSNELKEKSRFAANTDVDGSADMVEQAREIVEIREKFRLKRLALEEAKSRLAVETELADKAYKDAERDKCCELTDQIEKTSKTLVLSIKRASKHHDQLLELERALRTASENATDWPTPDPARSQFGEKPYTLLIGSLASHYALPKLPPEAWPKPDKAAEYADASLIYQDLFHLRDVWRNPELNKLEGGDGWREASTEEMDNVA